MRFDQPGRRSRSLAQLQRDAALGRVGRTRRWVIAGVAGLTAGLAALVSAVAPGRTLAAHPTAGRTRVASARARIPGSPSMPPLASPSALGLAAPGQAPQSAPTPAPAPAPSAPAPTQQAAPAPAPSGGVVSGGS